ncbi:MAG TPA: zinc ribbon domain-containing protein [Nitrospirales bacterium]|nr:zinc ribbon domain-containing protein [Nitrospirales bacterium]
MALIDCAECGKQLSDKALACPHCGAPPTVATDSQATTKPSTKTSSTVRLIVAVLILGIVVLFAWGVWRAMPREKAAPLSAGLKETLRQPKKIVNARVQLNEGQHVQYSFTLNSDARVQVKVTAQPKQVDVMLMTRPQAEKFREAAGNLFGGQYAYQKALSSQSVLQMNRTGALPRGEWSIIVKRPSEALLFQDPTDAEIVVTVY